MIIPAANIVNNVEEYFFSSKLRQIALMKEQGIDVINLGIGNPDGAPNQEVIKEFIREVESDNSHGYQAYKGNPELLSAFCAWYKKHFNVDFSAQKNILPLSGSKEGISFILHAFINPGDEALIPNPGYPTYTSAALLHYANVKYYDLLENKNFEPDFEKLESLVSERTKILFLNYPHMPTGIAGSIAIFQKFVDFATKHKILLVNDNPYVFLHNKQLSIFNANGAFDVALELNSLSKSHNMAGWRIGIVVGNEEYINLLLKMRSNMNSGHFLPFQTATIKALSLPNSWYEEQREHYNSRRENVEKTLEELGFYIPKNQAGMFVWAKIPEKYKSGQELSEYILDKAQVYISQGNIFGSNGQNFIRISLSTSSELLNIAMDRIKIII